MEDNPPPPLPLFRKTFHKKYFILWRMGLPLIGSWSAATPVLLLVSWWSWSGMYSYYNFTPVPENVNFPRILLTRTRPPLNLVDRLLISYDALFRDVNILMNCTPVRNLLPTQSGEIAFSTPLLSWLSFMAMTKLCLLSNHILRKCWAP